MPGLSKTKRVAMHCGAVNMISSIFAFWCEPFSLLLTWIAFFSVVLWWLRKSRSRDVHGLKGDGRRLTHFRDLPSPRGFPVVGNVVQLGAEPYRKLAEWADAYGPLYRIRMGTRDVLIVTGLDVIKKTAAKQSIDFAGRPELETNKLICGRQSITFNDYSDHWMRHKRCAKEALQLYTTGKDPSKRSVMEDCAFRHANHLVDQVLDQASREEGVAPEPFSLRNAINSISEMCFGHEFKPGDRAFDIFLGINKNFDGAMGASQVVNFWPFLKYVPFVGTPYKNLKIYSDDFWSFVLNLLKDHWRTYRPDQMRDFVDCLKYRSELANREDDVDPAEENMNGNQQKRQTNGAVSNGKAADPAKYAPGKQQSASPLDKNTNYAAADVFGAGFDTVHTVVTWAFFYLAVYPETQTKIRDELARVMAPDEQPTLRNHGPRCPYTQAWLYEVLRHVAIVPLFIPHQTTKGTVLENCYIPPGVMVIFNFWQTTRDPLLWDDPEEFRPERFLRTNPETGLDELRGDMAKNVIAWGLGVRQCLGAQLSRHQLFIFITTIVRRCLIAQSRPGIEPVYPWPSKLGLTIKPEPFKVSISPL